MHLKSLKMKLLLSFLLSIPLLVGAQKNQFTINGSIVGFEDGVVVDLINGNNGTPEQTATLKEGKFQFKGNLKHPDIKLLSFNKSGNFIPVFIEPTEITVNIDANNTVTVIGSKSHEEFIAYSNAINPYMQLLNQQSIPIDDATKASGIAAMEGFLSQYGGDSYVAPYAIFRIFQFNNDTKVMEAHYQKLSKKVQETPIAQFMKEQIDEAKVNAIGTKLDDFTQEDVDGKPVKLSSFKGKYVLVDFWASWCRPCRDENPNVVAAYNRFKNKNFTVLGVSLDRSKDPWIQAIQKDNLTWTHVSDLKGWSNQVAVKFKITSIPQNILIGPDGTILAKNLRGEALHQALEKILK